MLVTVASGAVIFAGATFITGSTITIATLISAISSELGSLLIPIMGGYAFTETLNLLAQELGGSDNIITITGALVDGIANTLAELIYNNL
ncbi:MAG: hypothetical protein NUV32_10670 [Exilispira sp.]|jgi:hypothetical protein|nr:hypothetical protein [Exilispira sp.]